jgi:uncharacterized protein
MPQVELSRIVIDEKRQDQIIVLKEKGKDRQFPIVIGLLEASSIKLRLSGTVVPRPMTHDLLAAVIQALGGRVEKVIIDDLVANTFHAKLVVKDSQGREIKIDCRPSDAVAVAVRTQAPIFAEEEVIQKATVFKVE